MRSRIKIILSGIILLGWAVPALAGEGGFAWTYTTDLVEKGEVEFEHMTTTRWQKEHGSYQAWDFSEAVEYGVTENFQASLYLNHRYARADQSVPEEDPLNPGYRLSGSYVTGGEDVPSTHNSSVPFSSYQFDSVAGEFVYRVWNPQHNPVGLALYFEPEFASHETEFEWKVILQKNWLDDRLVWAGNVNYGLGFEEDDNGDFERESTAELFTALSYRFVPQWSAALELGNRHAFENAKAHEYSAWFLGPTLHYEGHEWWATLGFLHQLPVGDAYNAELQQFAEHKDYILGGEQEKYYLRLKIGFDF